MIPSLLGLVLLGQGPRPQAVCLDLQGRRVIPLAAPAPKATVLIFYIAHCPIAQKMTPEINRIYKEFQGRGVRFYMVHEDTSLSSAEVAKEAKSFGLMPQVLIDKWHSQMKLSGARTSPEAFVYDTGAGLRYKGRITDLFFGIGQMKPKATTRDLHDALEIVVDGKKTDIAPTPAIGCVLPKS